MAYKPQLPDASSGATLSGNLCVYIRNTLVHFLLLTCFMLIRLLIQPEELRRVEGKLFFLLHSFILTSIKGSAYLYAVFASEIGKNKKSYL